MITSMDIENKEFKKGFRGYHEEEVDEFLDLVKEDFENLYRENLDLKEKLKLYQEQVSRYKSIEDTLKETLKYLKSHAKKETKKTPVFGELWNIASANNQAAEKNPYQNELYEYQIDKDTVNIFAA